MNAINKQIIEDYRANRETFERLGDLIQDKLTQIAKTSGIVPMAIQHRVKAEKSLLGKLYRSGDWYKSFDDLMDILGARVILYFADEVDVIGKRVEEAFEIDRRYSSDKRALLAPDAFGYLSLHYICTLKEDEDCPPELLGRRFEIQIRTGLQHIWADIDHDLIYKSQFGVPREIQRDFSRLAGLLELADQEFMRVRDSMIAYTENIRQKIENNTADEVPIDMVSLSEYMLRNREMRRFLDALAQIEGSEITDVNPEAYISQLSYLKITTLGGLQQMQLACGDHAYAMAKRALSGTELDILSSNIALRFLCRAYLLDNDYTEEQMTEFFRLSVNGEERAVRQAQRLAREKQPV